MGTDHNSYVVAGCRIRPWIKEKFFNWEINSKDRNGNDYVKMGKTSFYPNQTEACFYQEDADLFQLKGGKYRKEIRLPLYRYSWIKGFDPEEIDKIKQFDIVEQYYDGNGYDYVIGKILSDSHHERGPSPVNYQFFQFDHTLGHIPFEKLETDLRIFLEPMGLWNYEKFGVWNFILSSY